MFGAVMTYNPEIHHRRSIRLKGYDYTRAGAYFITICVKDKYCLFGKIMNGKMKLNELGQVTETCWIEIPNHFPNTNLDEFVIMPNHVHGIIVLRDTVGERHAVHLRYGDQSKKIEQFGKPVPSSIPTIIRSFKSAVTRHINILRQSPGTPVWQRDYYEHIIRNETALNQIRQYIIHNPFRWKTD